ncbi:transmembrane gamma-carboxyglutamic acid protein 2 [Latimeria chalumnae]|uniref:transmembrane gamma-carboxyglutamic acid protein 2 n=1 Tax=Latimeria chalumnae TaxID=7897 RepID=UPI00313E5EF9
MVKWIPTVLELDVKEDPLYVEHAYRIPMKSPNNREVRRTIIANVSSVADRDRILMAAKRLNDIYGVFLSGETADSFLGRKLLYNSWDFELITPGNLERECYEEVCNYEEVREVMEDDKKTAVFWENYIQHGPHSQGPSSPRFDVGGLIAGLIAAVVLLLMIVVISLYYCKYKRKHSPRGGVPVVLTGPSHPSLPPGESVPLTHLSEAPGLPSYEEALEASGHYDAPPPPYRGAQASVRQNPES